MMQKTKKKTTDAGGGEKGVGGREKGGGGISFAEFRKGRGGKWFGNPSRKRQKGLQGGGGEEKDLKENPNQKKRGPGISANWLLGDGLGKGRDILVRSLNHNSPVKKLGCYSIELGNPVGGKTREGGKIKKKSRIVSPFQQ